MKEVLIKEDILREAQKLFQTYGLKKTTMEDIAKALGKGKSTLYYYYQNKELIFEEVLQKELLEVFELTKLAVESAATAEDKLKVFAITRIKALGDTINLYKLVCGDSMWQSTCNKTLFSAYAQQEISLVASILQFGISKKEFNPEIEKELDLLPMIIVSCIRGIEKDYFSDQLAGLEKSVFAISRLMVDGLKTKNKN